MERNLFQRTGKELNVLDALQNNTYFLTSHHPNGICYSNIDFFFFQNMD